MGAGAGPRRRCDGAQGFVQRQRRCSLDSPLHPTPAGQVACTSRGSALTAMRDRRMSSSQAAAATNKAQARHPRNTTQAPFEMIESFCTL